ncbi:MAG: ABC transporter ATP-binding protein [Anaerovoracaceae bacterium]
MIEVRHLTKRYGDREAVSDISFTVKEGHIYGFLGPNGAGKSTTMNMITGYTAATEGEILINGHDILKEPKKARACIGYLPEIPPLYQDMTVKEYLSFAAEIKGIKKAQRPQAVADAIKTAMLEDVENRLNRNLSKGYKQRVGVAQAIIGLPEVLILDEPTSGLDPKQIVEIRDLIRSLGQQHTVILSSHILSEVSAVCDHVIMISEGKIVADDTLENLTMEKTLEEVFLERTDADRMDSMDAIDFARQQQTEAHGEEQEAYSTSEASATDSNEEQEKEQEAICASEDAEPDFCEEQEKEEHSHDSSL